MFSAHKDMIYKVIKHTVAAGTTEQTSDIVDMEGFDSITFILNLGTVVDTAVITAQVQQNDANSTSGMTDLSGAVATITASTNSDNQLMVTVHRPTKRYVRLKVTRTTANVTIENIVALVYNGKAAPVTLDTDIVDDAEVASPDES